MTNRHKKVEIFNGTVNVGTGNYGVHLIPCILDHVGKLNHKIACTFAVSQPNPNMIHDIKLYLMNELQIIEWLFNSIANTSSYLKPPIKYVHNSGQVKEGNFEKNVTQSVHGFFVLDNSYSTITSKQVSVMINEEWDENVSTLDVVTTVPPQDKSLNSDVLRIIEDSKADLKIISPYIDMSLIGELLTKHQQGVNIKIITRTKDEFNGKDKKDTFDHLQKNLKTNHKMNKNIHSRIIIRDEQEALVSSADLTYDSLIAQFNVGIVSSDVTVLKKLLEYFNIVWQKS